MKDLYREETNKDVYADECCMQPSASYSDEYVHWLEAKLSQYNVGGSFKWKPIIVGNSTFIKALRNHYENGKTN